MTAEGAVSGRLAEALRSFFAASYAATTSSGTLALMEALRALEVGAGQEVVLPTYVCPEVLDAVLYLGAIPVLCDIDEATYAPTADTVASAVTTRTRAVVVTHMFGVPAEVDRILGLGVPVVEDLAQGLGACLQGQPVGAWGAVTVLSFKAMKMVSCGEGGAVVIRDAVAADRLRGLHERRDPHQASFRFPLSDLGASVALSQWRRLTSFVERRRALARRYIHLLRGLASYGVGLPNDFDGRSWFRFPVTLPHGVNPMTIRQQMATEGVQVRQPVACLLHRVLGVSSDAYPVAERVYAHTLSLPLYPALTKDNQDRVVAAFRAAILRAH
jgi:dTDP-4-amino-4,6-dideoxygalactose transaminase